MVYIAARGFWLRLLQADEGSLRDLTEGRVCLSKAVLNPTRDRPQGLCTAVSLVPNVCELAPYPGPWCSPSQSF